MKNKSIICFYFLLAVVFISCEKDVVNGSITESKLITAQNKQALKKALHSAPNGWVMMVKSTASSAYVPVIMKFDTTKNTVITRSIYRQSEVTPSYFEIEDGTGSILLTFTTGSDITSLFKVGSKYSDITDHIFKVISVSDESIEIRGYRSGGVYKPEGGVVYKLFKRPANWDWIDKNLQFDLENTTWRVGVVNRPAILALTYADNTTQTANLSFGIQSAGNIAALKTWDPFVNVSAKPAISLYPFIITNSSTAPTGTVWAATGNNGIDLVPYYTGAASYVNDANTLINRIKTHYLILTNITRSNNTATAVIAMDFVAYDKDGKESVNAKMTIQ
jgi:hypothetical protein